MEAASDASEATKLANKHKSKIDIYLIYKYNISTYFVQDKCHILCLFVALMVTDS